MSEITGSRSTDRVESSHRGNRPWSGEAAAERVLIVLDPEDPASTLRAALGHPGTVDCHLDLLVVVPASEYQARRRARIDAGLTGAYIVAYTVDQLETEARRIARRVGHEWLEPDGTPHETMGAVGRVRDCVRDHAGRREYARVYVTSPQRRLWQRLLGVDDLAASVARVLPTAVSVISVDTGEFLATGDHDLVPV